jgi:L-2-hydroxyglutarate oxidase
MSDRHYDLAIIGGGIIGVATARSLLDRPGLSIVVLEAESELARHQSGRNSGVIHAGLYYRPGSFKARLCTEGREELYRFCQEQEIPHRRCGKLVLATDESELPALEELETRARDNGLEGVLRLDAEGIREHEPNARGVAALWVPQTGVVDFAKVTRALARRLESGGGEVRTDSRVVGIRRRPRELVLETESGAVRCSYLVNCAGLQSDRIARLSGFRPDVRLVPFRGEYFQLVPERRELVRGLIYPVPDPRFPFLGVHFTRTIDNEVEAGPNAVLALHREGYSRLSLSLRDTGEVLTYPGFWRLARSYWQTGIGEMHRSLSTSAFVAGLQRLVPAVTTRDVRPAAAGVRAQAVDRRGRLLKDFSILEDQRTIQVLNAPSPAATAALAIGRHIASIATKNFDLPG